MMNRPIHILGISGSLRKGSLNSALLRAAVNLKPPGMEIEIHELADVPLYNADIDGKEKPPAVQLLRSRIAAADGLLIATPEYNYSVPGVLKNAIDWASRGGAESPLTGKPAALFGIGGMMGTSRAQLHLRQILLFNGMLVLPKPEVYISSAPEKIDAAGQLTDEPTSRRVGELLQAFLVWTRRFGAS